MFCSSCSKHLLFLFACIAGYTKKHGYAVTKPERFLFLLMPLGNWIWKINAKPQFKMLKLKDLDPYKSMHPDGIHPRVLGELADIIAGPLSVIFQWSWQSGEVPVERQLANVVPIFQKGTKEDPGNYRLVSLRSVPAKITEKIVVPRRGWGTWA